MTTSQTYSFEGNILYVGGSGPGNYTTIQSAINDAVDGDTVFVFDDNSPYYECLSIKKIIKLIGENKETTIIDGNNEKSVIDISIDNITISDFSIRNSGGGFYQTGGIRVDSNNNKIKYCDIFSNTNGIKLEHSSDKNIISDCRIFSNRNYGINAKWSDNNEVHSCIISDNEIGIELSLSNNWIITNNVFTNNGIVFSGGSNDPEIIKELFDHKIENNSVNGESLLYLKNRNNIYLDDVSVGQIIIFNCKNIELKKLEISNTDTPIIIAFCEDIIITKCSLFSNNRNGLIIRYGKNIEVLDCDINNNYERGLLIGDSTGCHIKNCYIHSNRNSGICLVLLDNIYSSSKNHKISNCKLMKNNESGIEIKYFDKSISITNCIIKENKKHGIYLYETRKITVSYCNIESNHIYGIKILDSNKISIHHNNFINNSQHIYFESLRIYFLLGLTLFRSNYWDDRTEKGPYRIKGEIFVYKFDPFDDENREKLRDWIFYDWFPVKTPHDITTAYGCGIE
jgi:parallel beta-helix repeat protein